MAERDANGRFIKGHIPWSKGLTKEIEPRLAELAIKTSVAQKGVSERKEVVEQMSERFKKWHEEHPGVGKAGRLKQLEKRWADPKQHTKMSQRVKGSGNPAWKGGISQEEYSEAFSNDLKKSIKNRDDWKCKNCGVLRSKKILMIHHIDGDKLNNSMENLVTLCGSCHSKAHWKTRKLGVK